MATGPDHYREAERLIDEADSIMDADYGWMASLDSAERIQRRAAYLAAGQVHATLALAEALVAGATMRPEDRDAWDRVTGRLEPEFRAGGPA